MGEWIVESFNGSLRDQLFDGRFGHLCMGMSNDYRIAIEKGATIVRLGSTVFATGHNV